MVGEGGVIFHSPQNRADTDVPEESLKNTSAVETCPISGNYLSKLWVIFLGLMSHVSKVTSLQYRSFRVP